MSIAHWPVALLCFLTTMNCREAQYVVVNSENDYPTPIISLRSSRAGRSPRLVSECCSAAALLIQFSHALFTPES